MTKDNQVSALQNCMKLENPQSTGGAKGAVNNATLVSIVAFLSAVILQVVSYQTIEAPFVGAGFLLLGYFIFHPRSFLGGKHEAEAFSLFFSVCFFWAGVAGIYSVYLDDASQKADMLNFFGLATVSEDGLTLDELQGLTEGSGAVLVWRTVYDLLAMIGLEKGPYIAVTFNTFLVSISGVVAIKTVRLIFGDDQRRLARFILLFTMCAVFWLFAATLLRDSFVLLLNTLLVYLWVRYLMSRRLTNGILLSVFSLASTAMFIYLRAEFFFVPIAMLIAGVVAIFVGGKLARRAWIMSALFVIGILGLFVFVLPSSTTELVDALVNGNEQYGESAKDIDSGSSLGVAYVVDQPLPVRLIVGSFYLQAFPIPFWSGFLRETIYHLLKSLNAIFMWFALPLAVLGGLRSLQMERKPEKVALLFLVFVYAGFTLAIAGTSLETRHLSSFFVPLLIVATVPDLGLLPDAQIYGKLLTAWLGLIVLIHIAWAILKIF